jgi:hypothetical protein
MDWYGDNFVIEGPSQIVIIAGKFFVEQLSSVSSAERK